MSSIYDKASLVLIPSGTKTSKVYSQKPTNGDGDFTFSRSTAATRVNASGNIEKETSNLLLQSNTFSNAVWAGASTTETSGQSGYDGTNNAWLLEKLVANGNISQSVSANNLMTYSVYAKASTRDWLRLNIVGVANAYFDLANGVVGSTGGSASITSAMVDVGGGWYRCSFTYNVASTTGVSIYVADADNDSSGTSGNIYIQDAQLNQGLIAQEVITTTTSAIYGGITDNVPRLDYTDSSCPALLLEPQRSNLATLSEYFEGWSHKPNTTATSNYTTSPEGLTNATRLEFTGNGYLYNINSPTQVNGTEYTLSCYAKRNDSGTQSFGFFTNGSGSVNSAMTLTSEWKRFDYTYTATNASQLGLAGSSGADVSVFGFQVEAGSYATSYIPTYGSAVTRNVENCEAANAALIGQTEGTLFWEGQELGAADAPYISLYNNSNNRILLYYSGGNVSAQVKVAGVVEFQGGTQGVSGRSKMAVAYKNGSYAFYVDGVQVTTSTGLFSGFVSPQLNKVDLGYSAQDGGRNNQLLVFKTRLTNTELADLTTL